MDIFKQEEYIYNLIKGIGKNKSLNNKNNVKSKPITNHNTADKGNNTTDSIRRNKT